MTLPARKFNGPTGPNPRPAQLRARSLRRISPNSPHAPPIGGEDVNWGFQHVSGRGYLHQQNEAFAEAMIKAGYKQGVASE